MTNIPKDMLADARQIKKAARSLRRKNIIESLIRRGIAPDRIEQTIKNAEVAAELRRRMDRHLERAVRIDARGFPEGAGERYPGIPRSKVWKLRLLRLLAPLVRGQL